MPRTCTRSATRTEESVLDASRRTLWRVRRLAFLLAVTACGESGPPAVLHLGGDTVVLEPGARIIDIHVRTAGPEPEFLPDSVVAHAGDVLRLSSEDSGPHALVFDESLTDDVGVAFLMATHQGRSLPLTEQGSAWVVELSNAPHGRYTVRCLTHGAVLDIMLKATR